MSAIFLCETVKQKSSSTHAMGAAERVLPRAFDFVSRECEATVIGLFLCSKHQGRPASRVMEYFYFLKIWAESSRARDA